MTNPVRDNPAVAHALPFAAWVLLLAAPGGPSGWHYALRTVVTTALLLACRPWRWYAPPRLRVLPLAAIGGAAVFILWILPESTWFRTAFPRLHEAYLTYGLDITRWNAPAQPDDVSPYAPAVCGWPLTLVRLAGSAVVIAVAEEFFWRGFVYRALLQNAFEKADLGTWQPGRFLLVALLFGLEHQRWAAGLAAGVVYGLLAVRTRDIWSAVFAHVLTNLLLGFYVIGAGAYRFWG